MAFVSQTSAVAVLVPLTLLFQSAGMAALIHWVRTYLEQGMHRFGAFRSSVLMVRFTSVIIGLHLLTILLWAAFYRWNCFPSWESAFYFSAASYSTVGVWRSASPADVADPGSGRKCHRGTDVWTLCGPSFCDRNPAR